MELNKLRDNAGARKKRLRVGRGAGSGRGTTAGRGQKGQKSRSGVSIFGFEGGQMPVHMRLPKRGFRKPGRLRFVEVNIGAIEAAVASGRLDAGKPVDAAALQAAGLVTKPRDGVRLLGNGELTARLDVHVAGASKSAVAAVEKAGGSVSLPKPAA